MSRRVIRGVLFRSPGSRAFALLPLLPLFFLVSGCVSARIENPPLEKYVKDSGYGSNFSEIPHADKLRVVLAFSGGGTRAAALAYGVLQELRKTNVVLDGDSARLLDSVSTISSVSGGSFTSAYYGLYGERIFDDFEERFLRNNIEAKLTVNLFRPLDMVKLAFTHYSRTDMAMDLYDREVFDGATFEDLTKAGGPMLNINSTDIDVGAVFTFMQPVLDLICADLSKMRISQAVTASSAVPGIFAPLVFENRAGECGFPEPPWIQQALDHPEESRRRHHEARATASYLDRKKRPYIFLVDGGVADNIGARRLLADVIDSGGVEKLATTHHIEVPERVVYIIVNAQVGGHHKWSQSPSVPSIATVLSSVSGTGIYRYNFETIQLLRESTAEWSRNLAKNGVTMHPHVVEVAFENVKDAEEREFFNGVKTSFTLDDETIDRLIDVGGRLLRDSPDFKRFMAEVQ